MSELSIAEKIASVLSVLFADNQVVELRALDVQGNYGRPYTSAGFFSPDQRVKLASEAIDLTKIAKGVYFTLNPINPDLLSRCCNKVKRAEPGDLTKDKDILSRRWLLIDVDPIRISGIGATDEEKEAAKAVTIALREYLRGLVWPEPIFSDSGNGFHLLYRIDLPTDDGDLLKRVLQALAHRFDSDMVKVDKNVHNAARICKLPYTLARKGENMPDRPHRYSKFLEVPPTGPIVGRPSEVFESWKVEVVPVELLNALANEAPLITPRVSRPISTGNLKSDAQPSPEGSQDKYAHRLLLDQWLDDRGVPYRLKNEPDEKGRSVYVLQTCPFDPAHGSDSCIMQAPNGKLSAHCFHDGCSGNGWQEFKVKIGKPEAHHYDPPMGGRSTLPESTSDDDPSDERLEIPITTKEFIVNNQVLNEMRYEKTIFQRNGQLVRIVLVVPEEKGPRISNAPRIEVIPNAALRDLISLRVNFVRKVGKEFLSCHPPDWCVGAIASRASYPGFRHLVGVVSFPSMRPDGSILSDSGYDPSTGLVLHWPGKPLVVPDQPTHSDATAAVSELLDVVSDFPFQSEMHRAAWLAGLLTPLARPAFDGPSPLFLVDANIRAAGKGMLLEVISQIVTGNPFPVISYPSGSQDSEEELRKKITTLLMYGDRLALFDNLTGGFGDGTLDRCLTSTEWQDRQLGSNRQFRGPMNVTFFATGNNVSILADTARRVCHIRLESPEERPECRSSFKRPNLIEWVTENRERLLAAALTILRAYDVAGSPDQELSPWGSFESWSRLVRNAIVWCGLPDPGETRQFIQEEADEVGRALRQLLRAMQMIDPNSRGLTSAEIVKAAYDNMLLHSEVREMLREAVEFFVAKPDARKLGCRLRGLRRRVIDGLFLDLASQEAGANRWVVKSAEQLSKRAESSPSSHSCPSNSPTEKDMEDIKHIDTAGSGEPGEPTCSLEVDSRPLESS